MKIVVHLPIGDSAELTGEEINTYVSAYCQYTPASVIEVLARVKRSFGSLDETHVVYYLAGVDFGGLGRGVKQPDINL
jgi:hypothetical protein